jgi:hypothetical protein
MVFIVLLLFLPGPFPLPGGVQGGEGVGDADVPAGRLVAFLQKKTHLSMLRTTSSREDRIYPPVLIIINTLHNMLPAYHCIP